MENLKLDPGLLSMTNWVSGNSHEAMNVLSHLQLQDNGTVIAFFIDQSSMDVTELFPASIIESYRSHHILVRC